MPETLAFDLYGTLVDPLRIAQQLERSLGSAAQRAAVQSAGLESWLDELISVDEVQTYKPSPLVYQYAAERLGQVIGEIRLISSNPFDVIGATAVGMQVAWLDR